MSLYQTGIPNDSSVFSTVPSSKLSEVSRIISFALNLCDAGRLAEAEACFRGAIKLDPGAAAAHAGLGRTLKKQQAADAAVIEYRKALALDDALTSARRELAALLVQLDRHDESLPLWRAEFNSGAGGLSWMRRLVNNAMASRDLSLAGKYAEIVAELRWGHPTRSAADGSSSEPKETPSFPLSVPKLRHDVQQFRHLQRKGILGDAFAPVIDDYEGVIQRMVARGAENRAPLGSEEHQALADVYNRLVYVRPTARVKRALSGSWDAAAVERQYINNCPGVVVIDDLLSREALEGVRLFCLESTVWFCNRYGHGRLGAFFQDGFNCPLLLQIAEELRDALPCVIGNRYPLRQMWGFKNTQPLPADATTHADFAAVNVNFWITPEEANLDESSGGLVIYDVDAPMHWDFDTYNGRSDIIKPFLIRQKSHAVTIPYRQNRAIIFNSDLFHGTAGVRFRPEYENHRINVTMLYGDRENEVHHRQLARPDPMGNISLVPGWRSASLQRFRKARP